MEGFLYSPSLLRDLLLPWLDLISLWNLYQTSSFHLRTLGPVPDVTVFRRARVEYHGHLYKPLKKALPKDAKQLRRCIAYFFAHQRSDDDTGRIQAYALATFPYAWMVAVAPVHSLLTYAYDLVTHGHKDAYLQWKAEIGWEPPHHARQTFVSIAIRGGLPELALSQFGPVDLHIFFRDALESTTAVSLDFLAQDDPRGIPKRNSSRQQCRAVVTRIKWIGLAQHL